MFTAARHGKPNIELIDTVCEWVCGCDLYMLVYVEYTCVGICACVCLRVGPFPEELKCFPCAAVIYEDAEFQRIHFLVLPFNTSCLCLPSEAVMRTEQAFSSPQEQRSVEPGY